MQATTAITWFEIPAKDLERAVWFYESVLQQSLRRETMGPAAMAVFPYQDPGVGGALTHSPNLKPAADGSVIYLRTQRLDETLERVARAGGRVVSTRRRCRTAWARSRTSSIAKAIASGCTRSTEGASP